MVDEKDIASRLKQVVSILQGLQTPFALAGGLAASLYRREMRLTEDLDFLVLNENSAQEVFKDLGMSAGIAREADLRGGPLHQKKRKTGPALMLIGRNKETAGGVGVDFLLPTLLWVSDAIARAQDNMLDYGFGEVPTITVEDLLIAKFSSLQNQSNRFKDLDDIKSIFDANRELQLPYIAAQMKKFNLPIPDAVLADSPLQLRQISKKIKKHRGKRVVSK